MFQLKPFKVSLLKQILSKHNPRYSPDDLLALWTVTGGIARYVNMMMSAGAVTRESMINAIFTPGSPYLAEGRAILAEEFGPDYGTYFTILAAIASEEIDLVCEDELGGEIAFYEIKRDPSRFDSGKLAAKVEAFFAKHPEKRSLRRTVGALSLNDL